MQGQNKIDFENLKVGNYAYSDYTEQYYLVASLPNIAIEGEIIYALVRLDGCGYYYASKSIEELKKKISQDGGETIIYKDLIV